MLLLARTEIEARAGLPEVERDDGSGKERSTAQRSRLVGGTHRSAQITRICEEGAEPVAMGRHGLHDE
jgi:hypothetical protein